MLLARLFLLRMVMRVISHTFDLNKDALLLNEILLSQGGFSAMIGQIGQEPYISGVSKQYSKPFVVR